MVDCCADLPKALLSKFSSQSAIRMRRSQRNHSVTGRSGSVEYFFPLIKITRKRWEERNGWGVQPAAIINSHINVQALAAFLIPT